MSKDIAISIRGLSKSYTIAHNYEKHSTLAETLLHRIRRPFARPEKETFWALRDVSFDIKRGEVVGVIGRNGAGKSTLLKILSQITEPTRGEIDLYGRVGSLLEVGTGFHPELTGRENIYLNGAILGMHKPEITSQFDAIVEFAGVDKFLDTPVKRYSSGMYVRLAFAVAAHLNPEILIVDEVLAVGDAEFQKKCMGKMKDVASTGRTVIFVSHNMPAVTRLCSRAILLEQGTVACDGLPHDVASAYLHAGLGNKACREWTDVRTAPGNEVVRLRGIRVRNEDGEVTPLSDIRKSIFIEVEYDVLQAGVLLAPNLHFYNEEGVLVFVAIDTETEWQNRPRPTGRSVTSACIPGNLLAEGSLIVGVAISTLNPMIVHFYERDAVAFQVTDTLDGDSVRGKYAGHLPGVVRPLLRWQTRVASQNGAHSSTDCHAFASSDSPNI